METYLPTECSSKEAPLTDLRAGLPGVGSSGFHSPVRGTLRLAVGIATRGRPAILSDMLAGLRRQQTPADTVVVSYSQPSDIGDAPARFPEVTFLASELGLTRQRNAILAALAGYDVLLFLDDDFCLREDYIARMKLVFERNPQVVVATGTVLADGINSVGLSFADAWKTLLDSYTSHGLSPAERLQPVFNAYGCNMALRLQPIREHGLKFNEELPLYGWYEDVEFSRQLAAFGDIVRLEQAFGVHLGVKSGRQSGVRLGYSQIANPFYLARRGSVPWSYAVASMCSRSMKNLVRSFAPEPYVDRRGRLKGNLRGWAEVISGAVHPMRAVGL